MSKETHQRDLHTQQRDQFTLKGTQKRDLYVIHLRRRVGSRGPEDMSKMTYIHHKQTYLKQRIPTKKTYV